MQDPVTLHFFTQKSSLLSVPSQECHTCHDAGELFNEVTSLSDKLKLETHDLVPPTRGGGCGRQKIHCRLRGRDFHLSHPSHFSHCSAPATFHLPCVFNGLEAIPGDMQKSAYVYHFDTLGGSPA